MQINYELINNLWNSGNNYRTLLRKHFDYYKGKHSFIKSSHVQEKSNVAVNFIDYILDMHCSISTGIPPVYVPWNAEQNIDPLFKIFERNNIESLDSKHFLNSLIAGYSVEVHSFDENGIKITGYDPLEWCLLFDQDELRMAIHKAIIPKNSYHKKELLSKDKVLVTAYDEEFIYYFEDGNLVETVEHYYSSIPVVVFSVQENRQSFLNDSLINQNDLYNRITNNRVDELEYKNSILAASGFSQSPENERALASVQRDGMVLLPHNANLQWISANNETQKYVDAIKDSREQLYMMGKVPDRNEISSSLGTLSGIAVKYMFQPTLQQAKYFRNYFMIGLRKRISLINDVWRMIDMETLTNYEIQFYDNLPIDIKSIAEENNLLKDILPRKTLISRIPGIDVNEAIELSEDNSESVPRTDEEIAASVIQKEQALETYEQTFSKKIGELLARRKKELQDRIL